MPDISIAMTLADKVSPGLRNMTSSNSAFNKSLQETQQRAAEYSKRMDALQKDAASLKTRITESNKAVREARQAYAEYGDELNKNRLQKAIEEQEVLQNSLKDTQKAMSNARNEVFRLKREMGGGLGGNSLGSALMKSGLAKQFGASLSQLASVGAESWLGQPTASALNSIVSGAVSGASIGTMAGGFGIGTAIGAGVGLMSGAIDAATTVFSTKDEAFKSYYNALYDTTKQAVSEGIVSGSTIAGSREQTMLAFTQRFGSAELAQSFLDDVKRMAKSTNYSYDEITGYAKSLLNTYSVEEVFGVLQTLSDATAGLNLSSSDVNMFIAGLSRMRTTGKATQEYLNYFSERGVDVYAALAGTLGVDKSAIAGMVTGGDISGDTAAASILAYISANYGGLSEKLAGTYDAMVANLEDVMTDIKEGYGGSYNTIRTIGLRAESAAYGGELGAKLSALNSVSGSNQAFLDNLGEQYKREALSALLLGQRTSLDFGGQESELAAMFREYVQLEEKYNESGDRTAGLRMEQLREQAEIIATNAYESSEEFKMVRETELDSIEATRELTAAFTAWTNAYTEQQERSKGQASTRTGAQALSNPNFTGYGADRFIYAPRAMGVGRVPYDNFPALLHEGECVLTAQQARSADRSRGGVVVNIRGEFNVRSDDDITAIAEAVAEQFRMESLAGAYVMN